MKVKDKIVKKKKKKDEAKFHQKRNACILEGRVGPSGSAHKPGGEPNASVSF